MSKLNQIQSELKRINDAKFQELCDSYLHRLGYDNIKPIGSAIGIEKTVKGTPDSLIMLPNGKYVFVEYTTQQTGLFLKLSNDLAKCFDKEKTGIPISKLEEIILCHNSTLKPQEEEKLAELCQERGCALEIISIETLAFLCPNDFIKDYQKSAFATPLDIKLRFRDDELKTVDEALINNDLVIITGKAGVGKSRLGLECCKRFAQKYGY
jgi:hypothetical protein